MGFFSGSSDSVKFVEPQEVIDARKWLMDLLNQEPPTLPTAGVAPMTGTEAQGQQILSQFAGSKLPGELYTGLGELMKTASGAYTDITKAPYFKPIVQKVQEMGDIMSNRLARKIQIKGMGTSSPETKLLGREVRKTQETLAGTLAPFSIQERQMQENAIRGIQSFVEQITGFPIKKLAAIAQFGALPRILEQAGLDAKHAAAIANMMFPYTTQADLTSRIFSAPLPTPVVTGGGPSELEKISGVAGSIADIMSLFPSGTTQRQPNTTVGASSGGGGVDFSPINFRPLYQQI